MGPQCGVDPLDFLPQRPPLPGLLRGVEAHMRSTCAVRSTVSFSAAIPAEFPGPQTPFYLINRAFLLDRSLPPRVSFVPLPAPVRSRRKRRFMSC